MCGQPPHPADILCEDCLKIWEEKSEQKEEEIKDTDFCNSCQDILSRTCGCCDLTYETKEGADLDENKVCKKCRKEEGDKNE